MKKNFRIARLMMLSVFMMFLLNTSFAQQSTEVDAVTKVDLKEHYEMVFSSEIPEYRFKQFILPNSKNEFYWTRVRDRRLELDATADVTTLNEFINYLSENTPVGK